MSAIVYRGMDRSQLDQAYDVAGVVENFSAVLADFQERSRQAYAGKNWRRNLRYGDRPCERYDFLSCGSPNAPTYVFIHGGYWSSSSKEDYAFIADGPVAHGLNVVLAEYTLAPQATMTVIVAEIGALLEHLAASKVHMISAIIDLEPMSLCWLQDRLKLTPKEVEDYSPLLHPGKGAPTLIAVGTGELSELVRQSSEYAGACKNMGEHIEHIPVPGANHFTMLDDLANPNSRQMKAFMILA